MPGRDDSTRAALLLRLARQITGRHDLDDVLTEVFRCLRPLVDFGGGSIQLLDDDGWIQMAACDPIAPAHVMSQRIPLASSVAGRVILTEHPVYLPDIEAENDAGGQRSDRRVSSGVRSYFAVPLVADGRAIGVLQVDSTTPDAWSDSDRATFLAAAPIVAAAIQNARAQECVSTARFRTETVEKRLADAQHLVAAARLSLCNGDRLALERQLSRIESLLNGDQTDGNLVRLPRPRSGSGDIMHLAR
ncbi:MAG TPA: GAF domain-containing protein [Mycobacteriales bacterium]|nr:GAF domain-containing protein [Mycobacteriales bacterium]